MAPLLDVQNLRVSYAAQTGQCLTALAKVSFALQPGETLGVLGESGSGKSTLAAVLLRLLPAKGRIEQGAVHFEGRNLLRAAPRELEKIRGDCLALIFQEPSLALHPAIRVAEQIGDVLAAHKSFGRRAVREQARQILAAVFPTEVERIANSYPHQLSGGQRARVLIAQEISCGPSLIVADEPTASLDPETQQEILALFRALRQKFNLSVIWITHNPLLLEGFADRAALDILHHHENYGGTGYPAGLRETEIPVVSRIVSVIDAFDAMVSSRPYRNGLPPEEAIRRLIESSGTQFDPVVVQSFLTFAEAEMNTVFAAAGTAVSSAL